MKRVISSALSLITILNFIFCARTSPLKKGWSDIPTEQISHSSIKLGIDVLLEKKLYLLKNKRVGLITNQSGTTRNLIPTVEALFREKSVNLVCLFSPEHGLRGNKKAGEFVESYTDEITKLPVYSLYGRNKKPTKEMMDKIDVLIFDIQDIGIRTYTYIYTMSYAMEASAEYNKEFIVLDRPNPLGGIQVEGNILETEFSSFIGRYPIPYRHGMTVGELALLFNKEFRINCNLTIIKMEKWKREMYFDKTGLHWIPPSPHIPHSETALYYSTTGFIGELSTLCVGIGTTTPFEIVGAQWINPFTLANVLNKKNLPGIYFYPVYFIPFYNLFENIECGGVKLFITDREKFLPFKTGISILEAIKTLYPNQEIFSKDSKMFNLALGTDKVIKYLEANVKTEDIVNSFVKGIEVFNKKRKFYLLY